MSDIPAFPPSGPRKPAAKLRRVNRSFPALRSIVALVLREMSTRYGRSPGGYAWAILEPLGGIIVLSIGFSLLLRTPSLGHSFLLFYASGFLPFNLYGSIAGKIASSIKFSRSLLFYPAVTWLDAVLARLILNGLTGLLITYILLTAILIFIDARTTIDAFPLLYALCLAMLLGLGVGLVNCVLSGIISFWSSVWSIAMRPIFIVSGVIFIYEDMPAKIQAILWWNPLLHITGLMRRGIYSTYEASYVSIPYVLIVSMVCVAAGMLLMGRFHRTLLNQ